MSRRPAGFTLIELMISVAIVGILASVAVPSFRNIQLRTKQAERRLMIRMIETALEDLWVREGRYPGGTATASTFDGPWNPTFPPGTSKKTWNRSPSYGHWDRLTLSVEGSLYFSYYVEARAVGGTRWRYVYGLGDLDGDGRWNYVYRRTIDYVVGTTPLREMTEYDTGLYDGTNY